MEEAKEAQEAKEPEPPKERLSDCCEDGELDKKERPKKPLKTMCFAIDTIVIKRYRFC